MKIMLVLYAFSHVRVFCYHSHRLAWPRTASLHGGQAGQLKCKPSSSPFSSSLSLSEPCPLLHTLPGGTKTWPILTIIDKKNHLPDTCLSLPVHKFHQTNPQFCFVHLVLLCSLTPSEQCGPFRGLNNTFSVVEVWIDKLETIPGSQWVVWIFQNVIRSEIFYFFITLIIM